MSVATHHSGPEGRTHLRELVGSGDRIALFVLPFFVVGLVLNLAFPAVFEVGGPPAWLGWFSGVLLCGGLIVWAWSVYLILTRVPRGQLITDGPYAVVKHPLYTSVALPVLPSLGFLRNSWLGVVIGLAMHAGCRIFARAEETDLATRFGTAWDSYVEGVKLPWL